MWKLDIRTTSSIRSNIDTGIILAATKLALMFEYFAFDEVREMSYTASKLCVLAYEFLFPPANQITRSNNTVL